MNPWTAAHQASLSITNSGSLFKLISIESVMPSNYLILCCPLLLLPSIFPSIRVFLMTQFFTSGGQNIGASASISVLPMNIQDWLPLGLTGLISLQSKGFWTVFFNTPQFKVSVALRSAFFMVQLSHAYLTTGKTTALIRQTFVGKVMSLFFNMLSRLVWRRKWQPTPVFLPGKSYRWRNLVGYSSWGHKESDTTERLHFFSRL